MRRFVADSAVGSALVTCHGDFGAHNVARAPSPPPTVPHCRSRCDASNPLQEAAAASSP